MNLSDAHIPEAFLGNVGSKTAYTGAGTTLGSWAMSNEGGVFIGILIGVVGILLSWYYKRKRDLREAEEHKARMCERCMKQTIRMYATGEYTHDTER